LSGIRKTQSGFIPSNTAHRLLRLQYATMDRVDSYQISPRLECLASMISAYSYMIMMFSLNAQMIRPQVLTSATVESPMCYYHTRYKG
jgi:hypothetical protein